MAAGLALFDLDRTLLDCNSGRLWMQHELRERRIGLRDAAWASWWLARYHFGLGAGLEDVYATAVRSLAGLDEDELAQRTARWFSAEVEHRLRPGGRTAIAAHRAAGDRLVLATSSSPYAGAAAAAAFGLDDVISTRFEVVDGRFTGAIAELALGDAKADRADAWVRSAGATLGDAVFYTDSITDLTLLERVGEAVAVNPDRPLRREAARRGWRVADWGRSG